MADRYLTVTDELLHELHRQTILLRFNSPAPVEGRYGWLAAGERLRLHSAGIRIEQNSGPYGGRYRPMLGGRESCGLAEIGAYSYSYSPLPEGIRIGRFCSISRGLTFIDSFHPTDQLTTSALLFRPANALYAPAVTGAVREFASGFAIMGRKPYPQIGHDVWIGQNVTLSMGIRIGHGAIIAADAVVTMDVPAYGVAAGNPARIVRMRFDDELIGRLLAAQWWNYDPAQVFETTDLKQSLSWIEDGKLDRHEFSSVLLQPDS